MVGMSLADILFIHSTFGTSNVSNASHRFSIFRLVAFQIILRQTLLTKAK